MVTTPILSIKTLVAGALVLCFAARGSAANAEPTGQRGSAQLLRARTEIAAVRYEAAAEALDLALAAGDNDAENLVEIYRLRGRVLAALGRSDAAQRSFQRMFALDPTAALGQRVAPKIMAPYRAAAKDKPAPLRVRVSVNERAVLVLVEQDPLAMITSVRAIFRAGGTTKTIVANGRDKFQIDLPPSGRVDVILSALDVHNNQLVALSTAEAPLVVESTSSRTTRHSANKANKNDVGDVNEAQAALERQGNANSIRGDDPDPPAAARGKANPQAIYKRWYFYGGISVALGLAGTYFGLQARSGEDDLSAFTSIPQVHDYATDVVPAIDSAKRDATRANVLFVASAAFAVASTVLYIREHRATRSVSWVPTATTDSAGVLLHGEF